MDLILGLVQTLINTLIGLLASLPLPPLPGL